MFNKNKTIFDIIDIYLTKRTHEKVLSLFLDNFNGNSIYIRFDYVRKLECYKIVWFDFGFFNEKKINDYINMQIVTGTMANNMLYLLNQNDLPSGTSLNEKIDCDRVEIIQYQGETIREYIFDRFLPLEWKKLIDPIVILFTYMPRSMECFLNEMFAKFDCLEEKYTFLKPILFSMENDDLENIFKPNIVTRGKKDFEDGNVTFLEKINDCYYAIVEDEKTIGVIIEECQDNKLRFYCNCPIEGPCKHMSAVIWAIKNKQFKPFYKIKYLSKRNVTLLDKVKNSTFYLCFGFEKGCYKVFNEDGKIYLFPVKEENKLQFEILDDDDNLTLTKQTNQYIEGKEKK